jgi:hypothetical protein
MVQEATAAQAELAEPEAPAEEVEKGVMAVMAVRL